MATSFLVGGCGVASPNRRYTNARLEASMNVWDHLRDKGGNPRTVTAFQQPHPCNW